MIEHPLPCNIRKGVSLTTPQMGASFIGISRQGKPFFMAETAARSLTGADKVNDPIKVRAAHGLQAAFRAALILDQPIIPFVTQLCEMSLREFIDELSKVGSMEIESHLTQFIGKELIDSCGESIDSELLESWVHLRAAVKLAN